MYDGNKISIMPNLQKLLDQAKRLADEADKIAKKYYLSSNLIVKTKPDRSPVTQADTEIEEQLNDIVVNEYKDAYLGEEGINNIEGDLTWIVDPIDGTKSFTRNFPVWGTLIAVRDKDELIVAYISAPALGKRWWATKGGGAWVKEVDGSTRQLHVSKVSQYEDVFILFGLDNYDSWGDKLVPLLRTTWRNRSLGDFYNFMLIAEGAADICLDSGLKLWDIAAPQLIIEEAGGKVYQLQDQSIPADAPRDLVATNGVLDPQPVQSIFE